MRHRCGRRDDRYSVISADTVIVVSKTQITCQFDLSAAAAGQSSTLAIRNIDFPTRRFDFHLDGAVISLNVPFNNAVGSFTRMYISAGWRAQNAYIDDIVMY